MQSSAKGKGRGEYWLIWRFEGVDTLSDLLTNKEFPYNVSFLFLFLSIIILFFMPKLQCH